jgi:3-hydroxyacyl-[acyl-carrier-protein] dehydratase
MMGPDEIEQIIPHRPPFRMVDRVELVEPGARIVAFKDVRHDEFWADAHFPGNPVMPGVLVVEALAQAAAVMMLTKEGAPAGALTYLVGMDKFRFRRIVRPGDVLRLEVCATKSRRNFWNFEAVATVGGERAANGSFLATGALE